MKNEQIIAEIAFEIYGEDLVKEMLENGIEIPLHTAQGWALRGPYRIKKGECGIEVRLWRKKRKENNPSEIDNSMNSSGGDFYLCKSFLFRGDQIERVV